MKQQKRGVMSESSSKITNEIQKLSGKIRKIAQVCIILSIVGVVGAMIGGVTLSILCHSNVLNTFMEQHPEAVEHIQLQQYQSFFTFNQKLSAYTDYRSALQQAAVQCFVGGVMLILIIVMLVYLKKVFSKIAESETPFTKAILGDLKIMFVIIAILCLENSILLGIIIGFVLLCLYKIFEYGCMLQKESDETL